VDLVARVEAQAGDCLVQLRAQPRPLKLAQRCAEVGREVGGGLARQQLKRAAGDAADNDLGAMLGRVEGRVRAPFRIANPCAGARSFVKEKVPHL
jgi:hypothetical protein